MSDYCTYETRFSNGFYYRGKGRTDKVRNGTYTGSGIRYRLALLHWENPLNSGEITATTTILNTYVTEAEAYAAEELLVPLELLADPFILNMHQGGVKGKYATPSRLLKKINSVKKKEALRIKRERAKVRADAQKAKLQELKKKLKESK